MAGAGSGLWCVRKDGRALRWIEHAAGWEAGWAVLVELRRVPVDLLDQVAVVDPVAVAEIVAAYRGRVSLAVE
ncbi:hypothetical protein ACWC5I_20340 [Kitasatospora sp. NPDC001574]